MAKKGSAVQGTCQQCIVVGASQGLCSDCGQGPKRVVATQYEEPEGFPSLFICGDCGSDSCQHCFDRDFKRAHPNSRNHEAAEEEFASEWKGCTCVLPTQADYHDPDFGRAAKDDS